jgi:hypothetical protein
MKPPVKGKERIPISNTRTHFLKRFRLFTGLDCVKAHQFCPRRTTFLPFLRKPEAGIQRLEHRQAMRLYAAAVFATAQAIS